MESYIRPVDVAHKLGVSDRTVRLMIAQGRLSAVYIEGRRKIARSELERYLRENTTYAA